MTHVLPSNASLVHLKNQAKDLLKLHKERNPESCQALRLLRRFEDATDDDILGAALKLADCQFALAMDYGFKSWPELKKHLESSVPEGDGAAVIDAAMKRSGFNVYEDLEALRTAVRIMSESVEVNVSDLHIEPRESATTVRFRLDGVLTEVESLPKGEGVAVIREIIHLGRINPTENRYPQDGKITLMLEDRNIIFRISVVPTAHGPVLAMRSLDRARMIDSIDALGFEPEQLDQYRRLIGSPSGLILVTGPTGVGKTTTLYASLNELNEPSKKIMTIEDPIEYLIDGIDQMPLRKGLSFANALRAMLRQAANVILVGETRDPETANIVFPAALSGHLIFSSLHAETAPEALTRFLDLGVEPFMMMDGLKAVVDQRLVRCLCPHCRTEHQPTAEEVRRLGLDESGDLSAFFRSKGCDGCLQTGYRGRTGVLSVLEMTDEVKSAVLTKDPQTIRAAAMRSGWQPLRSIALEKAKRGEVSIDEVLNVGGRN